MQEKRELTAFSKFIKIAGLNVDPASIRKLKPPAPDIQCINLSEGSIMFELVEVLDEGYAERGTLCQRTREIIHKHYEGLPVVEKEALDNSYRDAHLYFRFEDNAALGDRKSVLPAIFVKLLGTGTEFSGEIKSFNGQTVASVLQSITVRRIKDLSGPLFDTGCGGWVSDPTVELLHKKFKKSYKTEHPLELLMYIDKNAMVPVAVWKPNVSKFLSGISGIGQFRKIWIVDFRKSTVEFEYRSAATGLDPFHTL